MKAFVTLAVTLATTSAAADPSAAIEPYAAYVTYVTMFEARGTGDAALAIGTSDPDGTRCFAAIAAAGPADQRLHGYGFKSVPGRIDEGHGRYAIDLSRARVEVCQRFVQERTLADAIGTFATAMRATAALGGSDDLAVALEVGAACADQAERLAATGIAPLRKIVGPHTAGVVKAKLCNVLLAAGASIAR